MSEELPGEERETASRWTTKRIIGLTLKVAFIIGAYWLIFRKVLGREGSQDLWARLSDISWGWIAAGIVMQLVAISFATLRWRTLLSGQGIRPSWRFMGGSIMIARFFGAFTPGGFTGFGGWRIYDVAKHTGKVARATATIGVETFLGQAAMGVVIVFGSLMFGAEVIGSNGVIVLVTCFTGIIGIAILLLARPRLFRTIAKFFPKKIQVRVQTLLDAVCAYEGKGKLLAKAFALGVGVHAFNNLIYVCSAQAFGVDLDVGVVFFGANLTILATILPASINGLGLREMSAVALFSSAAVGLPEAAAILLMAGGFILCEMTVSAVGGLILLARRDGYEPVIQVDELEHEQKAIEAIEEVGLQEQPKPLRGFTIGLGAGALAGLIIGTTEAAVVIASGNGTVGVGVLAYGAMVYGVFCAMAGGGLGLALAVSGRWMKREAMSEAAAYARMTAFLLALFGFALTAFRVRRDVFHEELVWKSVSGLGVLVACFVGAAVLYLAVSAGLRWIVGGPGRIMLRAWGSPVVVSALCGLLASFTFFNGDPAEALERRDGVEAPEDAGNVLFIVVDTLRSDHLPAYGYDAIQTPSLDAFADDAIRFNMAFANASWTRPSFASILTGRMPSNHGVMDKSAALPDELVTMPEVFAASGWQTRGIATNHNVAPYYNFGQGFDQYEYLEPDFVLGADDAAAKLLLVQVLKRVSEKADAILGRVAPGSAYQDAERVNARVGQWLDEVDEDSPFFFFVGYMDPHDPYYPHPYDGTGYSRAANQHPDPSEAPRLMRLYDGEIEYWDSQFGQLIEDLKQRGVYDDLTIVVTSDHGEEFCEHGGFWHGTTLYDEQVRIPLFVKLPGNQRGGTRIGHWTQSVDLMPTLLSMSGLEAPDGLQGGDIFEGSDVVYAEESHEGNVLEAVRQRRGTDEWKLITANANNPRGLAEAELYRVDFDPTEQENLAEAQSDDLDAMRTTLARESQHAREGAVEAVTVEIGEEQAEKNCALGYMSREACCDGGFDQYCD